MAGAVIVLLVIVVVIIAAGAKNPTPPSENVQMRCPTCGDPVQVSGSRWECPWCGDFGNCE